MNKEMPKIEINLLSIKQSRKFTIYRKKHKKRRILNANLKL